MEFRIRILARITYVLHAIQQQVSLVATWSVIEGRLTAYIGRKSAELAIHDKS